MTSVAEPLRPTTVSAHEDTNRAPGLRLAFAGGGTGGHLTPGLHLLDRLMGEARSGRARPLEDLLWFTSGRAVEEAVLQGLEARVAPAAVERVTSRLEPPGGGAPSLVRLARHVLPSVLAARRALRAHRSEQLVGLGGFTCLPAVLAARSLGLETSLLEVNAVAGRATRWLAPFARRVLHATPASLPGADDSKHRCTGAPLAGEYRAPLAKEAARARLELDPGAPLLVVLGGSQGALGLNRFVRAAAPVLSRAGVQVLHQVGPGRRGEAAEAHAGYRAVEYVHDVHAALSAADFVLCRGGATTLAEVAALARPAWVVPYPHHADRHQARNAGAYGEGFELVEESELDEARAERLTRLVGPAGEDERAALGATLRARSTPDASGRILAELGLLPAD